MMEFRQDFESKLAAGLYDTKSDSNKESDLSPLMRSIDWRKIGGARIGPTNYGVQVMSYRDVVDKNGKELGKGAMVKLTDREVPYAVFFAILGSDRKFKGQESYAVSLADMTKSDLFGKYLMEMTTQVPFTRKMVDTISKALEAAYAPPTYIFRGTESNLPAYPMVKITDREDAIVSK